MAERTVEDLRVELAEVEAELAEIIGAVDFNVAGMTADEQGTHTRLMQRQADLVFQINVVTNGGTSEQNATNTRSGAPGGW